MEDKPTNPDHDSQGPLSPTELAHLVEEVKRLQKKEFLGRLLKPWRLYQDERGSAEPSAVTQMIRQAKAIIGDLLKGPPES